MEKGIDIPNNSDPSWIYESEAKRLYQEMVNDVDFDNIWRLTPFDYKSNSKILTSVDECWNKYLYTMDDNDGIYTYYTLKKDMENNYYIMIVYKFQDWDIRVDEYKSDEEFKPLSVWQTKKYLEIFKNK